MNDQVTKCCADSEGKNIVMSERRYNLNLVLTTWALKRREKKREHYRQVGPNNKGLETIMNILRQGDRQQLYLVREIQWGLQQPAMERHLCKAFSTGLGNQTGYLCRKKWQRLFNSSEIMCTRVRGMWMRKEQIRISGEHSQR